MSRFHAPARNSLNMALPSPVPSPRAATAILVHKARGEGQGEGTCSILCNVRVNDTNRCQEGVFKQISCLRQRKNGAGTASSPRLISSTLSYGDEPSPP